MPWGDVQVLNLAPLSPNPCPLSPGITRCFPFAGKSHAHNIKWRTHIWARAFPGGPVVQNSPSTARGACVLSLVRDLRPHMCHRQLGNPCVCVCMCESLSHVRLFATLWTVALQAPLSVETSRQEYWSGFPFPSPGDLPDPGIEPKSLVSPALAG